MHSHEGALTIPPAAADALTRQDPRTRIQMLTATLFSAGPLSVEARWSNSSFGTIQSEWSVLIPRRYC
jgi:hypothetical protein